MATAVLAGSTGLVGNQILTHLLAHPSIAQIHAYTRRDLPNPSGSTKFLPINSPTPPTWPSLFPNSTTPPPKILLSALGTTRAQAGSIAAQRAIDYQLNLDLAAAAKAAGVEVYVLISSSGANSAAYLAYPRMKGELEDGVKKLGFKHTVILRPGLIVGERVESRPAEAALRWVARGLGGVSYKAVDWWAQDAGVIGRAAVEAGVRCLEGKRGEGVWEVGMGEIVELGRKRE
ncbi:hypothetical protein GMOD_00009980 [Pyrenophora seminiperda CCB06]|uniref:NAD dependent epimerase/dehydratase family protein-like protein n=1 Tax=Pyrenophora seminiperda CCB06 TaxID=1302712 RepID=A0A3M7M1K8_9PLEO|nr:hypothetical protein GMOD_00009980 [Pyrenophora seminiperda CCB06]